MKLLYNFLLIYQLGMECIMCVCIQYISNSCPSNDIFHLYRIPILSTTSTGLSLILFSCSTFQSIEFFLAKEVTHFVTDKTFNRDVGSSNSSQAHTPKTPLTPYTPYLSESANVGSPNVSSSNESRVSEMQLLKC